MPGPQAAPAICNGALYRYDGGARPVSFEDRDGAAIPLGGSGSAGRLARWAQHLHRTFVRSTGALTALSLVPPLLIGVDAASRIVLEINHLVAASIVIPEQVLIAPVRLVRERAARRSITSFSRIPARDAE